MGLLVFAGRKPFACRGPMNGEPGAATSPSDALAQGVTGPHDDVVGLIQNVVVPDGGGDEVVGLRAPVKISGCKSRALVE